MLLQHINRVPTFTTDNNGQYPFRFIGQLQNYINNAYENVLTTSSLSSYATTTSVTAVASDLSALASSLLNYASKTEANTFSLLQTFTSGLTSTGVITANGGITATGQPITCGALSCTTETASGLITANGGLTIPAGQTLTCNGTASFGNVSGNFMQQMGDVRVNVSTANTLASPAVISMQTLFQVLIFVNPSGAGYIRITLNPAIVGQTFYVINLASANVYIAVGAGNYIMGVGSTAINNGSTSVQVGQNKMNQCIYVGQLSANSHTLMYMS
jgi:hypothetical protein